MRRRGWLAAIAVVLLANAVALALVAANRAGEPDAVVVLTDRELPPAWRGKDESGLALRLDGTDLLTTHDWLDAEKMERIGFDPAVVGESPAQDPPYWKLAERKAFVVLQYRGPQPEGSGLFAIDAGPDAGALRALHPDEESTIILPALIGLSTGHEARHETGRRHVESREGRILQFLTGRIHLPRRFHALVEPAIIDAPVAGSVPVPPRYRVTVAYGRRHEPWVVAIEPP